MDFTFKNRVEAGRKLGARLESWAGLDPVIIGLTRGGVPVAAEVAALLCADLDVLVVRKLCSRENPKVAIGAIAEGGTVWLESDNERTADRTWIRSEIKRQDKELVRRAGILRPAISSLTVSSRLVIIVDDGAATGATLSAAALALRVRGASSVIVAAPVASREAALALTERADAAVFLSVPELFNSVGEHYAEFPPVSSESLQAVLRRTRRREFA
ncbi:MAG: phosphoribosyl transferase [Elusimicrobia bacterium CG11_big_fil_rev_8_21_14_0_20_64_6]|nr:MAG: phosphoribosyl transferase [Elusimicrobia bacterium CG11_big_fil_rev_8_21_14_0_20_64_6]